MRQALYGPKNPTGPVRAKGTNRHRKNATTTTTVLAKKGQQAKQATQDVRVGGYFGDQQHVVVREYYGKQNSDGRCPPGLTKKNNGCMPPGQAKKWAAGQLLPRDVVFYPFSQSVVIQLGPPPRDTNMCVSPAIFF